MGSGVLQIPTAPPSRCSHEFSNRRNSSSSITSTSTSWCCFSAKYGGRTGGSDWERTTRSCKERSNYQDEFFTWDYEDEEESGFRSAAKRRNWWSDDSSSWDEDDEEEEETFGGFGILEGSIGFSSIFKLFRAFGWMVPAFIVSVLLGTGTSNGFVMALALPLAQSALSLIFDAVWGRSTRRARSKSTRWESAFARGAGDRKTRKGRKVNSQYDRKKNNGYQSWEAANNVSSKKREERRRTQSFGGWDELDKEWRREEEPEGPKPSARDEKNQERESKLTSRRARNKQRPLLMRLLIALFPFLGSWTKLL
ncbi:hypothetical protein M9H77_34849 [Catharanthus roseus]|uniref:Uncharacterized protein n=1 Tax=Catharanthus roseus TaxID=4058 RepID=A0ACB9ZMC3_CATRO|nr:hypothetical protein M9H77_34849 [Catharanthus roseus]